MPFDNRHLFTASAIALSCALAAPAAAQIAGPDDPAAVTAAPEAGEERLIAASVGDQVARASGGSIRPFGGNINPNSGNIRSFAGPISGTAGNIRSFQGDITESAGNIRSFAGNIRSFAGNIRSFQLAVNPEAGFDANFWGTLAPKSDSLSASAGNIRSFAGNIRSFSGEFEAMAGNIRSFAGNIRSFAGNIRSFEETPTTYEGMLKGVNGLVDSSKATWGSSIQTQTGKSFEDAFSTRMLDKYGIKLNDAKSLVGLNELGIELFLMDWYDNLNNYSGQDQVDHWMKGANWSPLVTQNLGSGGRTKIGILDFGITGSEADNVTFASTITTGTSGVGIHGSAVASLIVSKHDGRGVMGIAPGASVISYNPFDDTNTAGWTDVKNGVRYLLANGASVINMSLGVPNYTLHSGWNDLVFNDRTLAAAARKSVFVIAAGNEGKAQRESDEINWNFDQNPSIIVVGSVSPTGTISAFSNTPGKGKFKKLAGNDPMGTDMLRDRFIVAPGEFMLVSDGQGGVTRMSGTSFAAPLVSGTIALLHDRWPWLSDNPIDTVNIVLGSARDIGAPGTDDVYGRGMLDVQKALEPGRFDRLKYTRYVDGVKKDMDAKTVLQTSQATISSWSVDDDAYFYAFEDVGELKDSHRDFNIPISTKLIGQTVGSTNEQFNAYARSRFLVWINSGGKTNGIATSHFSSEMAPIGGLVTEAVAVPRAFRPGLRQSSLPYDTGLALRTADGAMSFRFGSGDGSIFTGQGGFKLQSDYDAVTGGANPFLGLASGAGYGSVDMKIGEKVTVSTGMSQQNAVMDLNGMAAQERRILGAIDPYRATANTLTVAYKADSRLTASMGYTLLNEDTGLLGVRSLDPTDLTDGSLTDAATFGADYAVTRSLTFSLAGTMGRTRAGETGSQGIAVAGGGIVSSAWQVGVAKSGLFDKQDRLRLTLAQPLHIENGELAVSMAAVIDRQTGEIGEIVRYTDAGRSQRRFVAEAIYGRRIGGNAELNLFGRANLRGDDQRQSALTLGGNFRLGF